MQYASKKTGKRQKPLPCTCSWLQDNLLPGILTLLAQDIAALIELDHLKVALLVGDFLGGELTHVGREVHEHTLTSVVGEDGAAETLTRLVLEGAYLHLTVLTREGQQRPALVNTLHNSLSSHNTILPFIR